MTTDAKLAAILAAIQIDPGNRGLKHLFTLFPEDFSSACRSLASAAYPTLAIVTGFYIPGGSPPAFETDGPLGTAFLFRALSPLGYQVAIHAEAPILRSIATIAAIPESAPTPPPGACILAIERSGPGLDGRCRTMRGLDVTPHVEQINALFGNIEPSIGIGDGGNEIGMGKIPHEVVRRDIPNGKLIHCRVPAERLVVAGVSNWGAYALAAGVYALRGIAPPTDLFDPNREREALETMVREGPLVDGVTGKQTATVDGLPWEEYGKPLMRIREILAA